MESRIMKTENDDLFWVELLHPRYGWIKAIDKPLCKIDAIDAQKRIAKWTPPQNFNHPDYIRKTRLYLSEIDNINGYLALEPDMDIMKKNRLLQRKNTLIEYSVKLLNGALL